MEDIENKVFISKATRPNYLFQIPIGIAFLFVDAVSGYNSFTWPYRVIFFVLFFCVGFFSMFTLQAQKDFILQKFVWRPFFRTKKIYYKDIYTIEIRRKIGAYQFFKGIINYNKKQDERSFIYFQRSFRYSQKDIDFLILAKSKGVNIKLNIDSYFKKDIDFLKQNLEL